MKLVTISNRFISWSLEKVSNRYFWIISTLWYITLIYHVGLSIGYGPEATTNIHYWTDKPQGGYYSHVYVDQGFLHEKVILDNALWKRSSFYGDAGYYLLQAEGKESIAPYHYRFIPTTLVEIFSKLTGMSSSKSFTLFNCICTLVTSILFTYYLIDGYKFTQLLALLGGTMSIAMLPSVRTLAFPMIDPATHLNNASYYYSCCKT